MIEADRAQIVCSALRTSFQDSFGLGWCAVYFLLLRSAWLLVAATRKDNSFKTFACQIM
jgi:hypothetical protein